MERTSPTGDWLAKILRPLTRKPPSTFTAVPLGRVVSAPPVDTRTMPSSATRRRVASAPGRPRRWRQAVKSTTWWCITDARAVEAQWRASSRWAIAT